MGNKYESHDFYCLNCGRKGINVWRSSGQQRAKNHRKKLFCPWCGQTVNHIECKTDEEVKNFKIRFEKGDFVRISFYENPTLHQHVAKIIIFF